MSLRQIEALDIADKIIERAKSPSPVFRRIHGPREEIAIINSCEFWRDQCATLSAALLEKQEVSMMVGEET